MSTKIGVAPTWDMASVVAMKVLGTVTTASPGPTPAAMRAKRRASVPEPTPMQYRLSQKAANSSSKPATWGPPMNMPAAMASVTAGTTSDLDLFVLGLEV